MDPRLALPTGLFGGVRSGAMAIRENPYGAFNFMVKLGDTGGEDQIAGGFSEVSGLESEVLYAEYRNGNDKENHARKIPTLSRTGDVTLKRGVIGDLRLFTWLKSAREGSAVPQTVTITLLDEARAPVCAWRLSSAQPRKWVGPALAAKGGGDVAVEELVLVAERVDFLSL
jgi:phage tail-like protein